MSALIGLLAVMLQTLAGLWVARRLGRREEPWWARISLAFVLGGALTGLLQIALSSVGMPTSVLTLAVLAALSVTALAIDRQPAPPRSTVAEAVDPRARRLLLGLALLVGLVGVSASAGLPFRSDGSKFWAPRARELADHGAREVPALLDTQRVAFHRGYPLLVPTLLAPAFAHSPQDAMIGAKLVLAAFHLALLGLVASRLLRCGQRGVWLLLAFLCSPMLVGVEIRESVVAAGFVDEVFAVYLLLLVGAVDRLRRHEAGADRARATTVLAVLAGAALLSTKLEGAVALTITLLAALLAGPRSRGRLLLVAAGALLLCAPTLWIRAAVASDAPILSLASLIDPSNLMARGLPVLYELLAAFLDVSALGLLPLLVVVALTWPHGRDRAFARLVFLGLLGFLLLVYLGTTMHVGRHVHTSLHRLLFQWMPALALLAARRPPP